MEDRPGGVTDLTDRRFRRPLAHPVACAARARSSAVEHWFYTPAVGGSIPSAPTGVNTGQWHTAIQSRMTDESPLCQECAGLVRGGFFARVRVRFRFMLELEGISPD